MSQVINTNVMSINTQRALYQSSGDLQTSMERLSSGLRINRAADDAAGLAIAERFTSQIRGLEQATRNSNDAISLIQTAEGALGELSNSLQRMRELAVQAANGTYNDSDRAALNEEYQALATEVTRITDVTEFNNINVLGSTQSLSMQVGWEGGADNVIYVETIDVASGSGVASALTGTISTAADARSMMSALGAAIDLISIIRADFGAAQNRLESTVRNNQNVVENQSAARSRIQDADFAKETANMTRAQILQQAGTAMLAQANQVPQNVMSLLRG